MSGQRLRRGIRKKGRSLLREGVAHTDFSPICIAAAVNSACDQ